ncbi:class I SAM-dependent methyltransferase [Calothrix rhizosoleniae]|uniref:class I SAM-dependent methyltransferase n=1 Tax=Calothrix rhizosoleniae TaxID=888997 RepID=UPI000B49BCFE|nr:class I SAM-dependent methyltransferase [Calothrix rhizosoleniae]
MIENKWDTSLYENKHSFVWQYGEDLLQLLAPQPGEQILDIGCGTGQLTAEIANTGAVAVGIDTDAGMITQARINYPQIQFSVTDGKEFRTDTPFDAVFSNAVLHWIPQADVVIKRIYQALKPGGRFIAEFGGKGNISAIRQAIYTVLSEMGQFPEKLNPWYFPSIGEYASLLEQQGFDVTYANIFKRPTSLTDGDRGMENWIRMFGNHFFVGMTSEQVSQAIAAIETLLQPTLYKDANWIADYRRIRIIAIRK